MAKDNRHSRKLRDDETIKQKKRVAKQDTTPGPISRPSDAFTLRRSSRKISSSKQTKENQTTSTRKSKRLEEQKPSATPPINDSFIFTNEDLCSARMAKDNRRSRKLKDDETIKSMKRVVKPSDASTSRETSLSKQTKEHLTSTRKSKRLEEQKPSATPPINDSSIFANEEDLCCLQKQKLNFVPEAELLLEAPMVVGNCSKNGLIKELSGKDDVGHKRKKTANITEPVPSASGTEGGEIAGACRGVSSVPSHDGSHSFPGNSLWCDADCDETSLQSLLKLNISKLCEVLSLSEDVKIMVEKFLEYVIKNYHVSKESPCILQAFLIALCWIGSALLKHKLDRRQSVALAKKHLNFICNEEEANSVYLKLEAAREMFLRHTENQKISDPIRASQATSTWSSNPQDVKVDNAMVVCCGSEHVDQESSKRTPTLSRNHMEGECLDKVVQSSSRSSVDHVVDVAISSVPADVRIPDGSHCEKDISPNDVEGHLGSLAVGCNQTNASKSLSVAQPKENFPSVQSAPTNLEIQNDSIQGHPSEINNLRSINVGKDDLITSEASSLHLIGEPCENPSVVENQSPACEPVTLSPATPPAPEAHNPSRNPEAPPQVLEITTDASSEAATPPGPLLERLPKDNLIKSHKAIKLKLKSDYDKEFAEMVAQLNLKYAAKHEHEDAAFQSKMKQFEAKCQDVGSFDSMGRQGAARVHQFPGKPSSSGSQQVMGLQPPLHQEPVVGLANKDKQILSEHKVCSVDGNKLVCDDVQEKHHNSKTHFPCQEAHDTFISEQIDRSPPGEEVVGNSCRVIGVSKPNSNGIADSQQPTASIEEAAQPENAGVSSSAKKQSIKETFVSDGNTFLKDRPAHLLDHPTKGSLEPKTGAESIKDPCKQPSAMDRRIKRRVQWSEEEEEMLKEGVQRFSALTHKNLPWKKILKFGHHVFDASRNASHLKDKWRNMVK